MKVVVAKDYDEMVHFGAKFTVHLINMKEEVNLALATGNTMIGFYRELVRMYMNGEVSFLGCTTFNLDEYVGIPKEHPASFHYYMKKHFINLVDIPESKVHIPDGNSINPVQEAMEYEEKIKEAGGLDIAIAGIGVNGHIAFNEPGSSLSSRTRVKSLNRETRKLYAKDFGDENLVPKYVITMGVGTIMEATFVLLLASGEAKAQAVAATVEGPITAMVPASILQMHQHAFVIVDQEAASLLKGEYQSVPEALGDPFEEYFWGL